MRHPSIWGRLLAGLFLLPAFGSPVPAADWRTASRESVGLAPDPAGVREAMVQVYAARAVGWRGRFAVHSWIAVKPPNASAWTVYEVIGWRAYRGLPPLVVHGRPPDGRWFGAAPEVLCERRGEGVERLIAGIEAATRTYPYGDSYRLWPGPNSNTYVAHVLRSVPELACKLPGTAIGKDFLVDALLAPAPSGSGLQVSLWGLLGVLVSANEGVELNLLGFVFGVDPADRALKLPIVGRVRLGFG